MAAHFRENLNPEPWSKRWQEAGIVGERNDFRSIHGDGHLDLGKPCCYPDYRIGWVDGSDTPTMCRAATKQLLFRKLWEVAYRL